MEKCKYQIFISSTKEDLIPEREAVSLMVLKAGNIPAGMENFSASTDRGWEIITNTIDNSDIFVLIIAGRYGSIEKETGLSWTEKEYNYADSKNMPILSFIRKDSSITIDKTEKSKKMGDKLDKFKNRIRNKHHCEQWNKHEDLQSIVSMAIQKEIDNNQKKNNLLGWFRGNTSINHFLKENVLRFSHVNLTVSGSQEECLNEQCELLYNGSSLFESPDRPIIYMDTIKTAFSIKECEYFPNVKYINHDAFKRNPTSLSIRVEAPESADSLYMTGRILINTKITKEKGGFGLHIPYFAQYVTLIIDLSLVDFLYNIKPSACLVIINEEGVNANREDLVKISEKDRRWTITALNAPKDSNIMFYWGE